MKHVEARFKHINIQEMNINEMRTQNGGCTEEYMKYLFDKAFGDSFAPGASHYWIKFDQCQKTNKKIKTTHTT